MAGVATATPLDASGALLWNSAAITALPENSIQFGMEMFKPSIELTSAMSTPGGLVTDTTSSDASVSPIPSFSMAYHIEDSDWTVGMNAVGVSGFGLNYPASSTNPLLMAPPNGFGSVYSNFTMLELSPTIAYKMDAVFAMVGMLLGIGIFEEAYSSFVGVRDWGDMGIVSLSDWMGISNGFIVLMVVAMAVAAFSVVGFFERKAAKQVLPKRAFVSVGATVTGAVLVAAVQFAGPGDARAMGVTELTAHAPSLEAVELASLAVEGRNDYLLIDLRPADSAIELPGAWTVAATTLTDQRTCPDLPDDRRLIVVDDSDQGQAREVAFT
ncbi:MAG: hypothetical protein GY747_12290 [Planctomycetes bacterium]|nr:hypothetical protein [Planctomycetota bacterium]MCP4771772.1 hypothetical protein [Planctomycetota bacterium]MCP4860985.1 hypothetical protein [Planctomycetota bacterium]